MIRNMFIGLFMMLALSGFAFAASSEIVTDFSVGVPTGEVLKDVSLDNSAGDYLGYAVLVFIVLALVYFASKKKKVRAKKVKKKSSNKNKSSRKK